MDDKHLKELGNYLRTTREQANMGLRSLAEKVSVDHAQLVRLEQGKIASPKADLLGRLADELGVPVTDLMTLAGYPTAKGLPNLRPYMRAKYRDLPAEAVDEVERFVATLQARHGGTGPRPGEDEG